MMNEDLMSLLDAAEYADVERRTIHTWIYRGKRYRGRLYHLEAVIHKGKQAIRTNTLDAFLDQIGYEPTDEENDEE